MPHEQELARERAIMRILEAKSLLHEAYQLLAEGHYPGRTFITPVCVMLQSLADAIDRDFNHYRPQEDR